MPERYEVEAVPASEIREGDEILTVSALGSVRKTVFSTLFAVPPENGAQLTFTDADALNLQNAESLVLRVAARGGTEDELREALKKLMDLPAGKNGERGAGEQSMLATVRRIVRPLLAARAASTPEEEQSPGSSDPMPPERRAGYQRRIEDANCRHRIDPTLHIGGAFPGERPEAAEK